jgi:hypothetical protein
MLTKIIISLGFLIVVWLIVKNIHKETPTISNLDTDKQHLEEFPDFH